MSPHDSVGRHAPVPPYRRIARELRAEIDRGRYAVGDQLPTQHSLSRQFNVARTTIQRALDELREHGYIDSQQGRGAYVLDRLAATHPRTAEAELGQRLDAAFEAEHVTLDAICFTSETLHSVLHTPLQRIHSGEIGPASITVRLLLPSLTAHIGLPQRVGAPEDDRPLQRMRQLTRSHALVFVNTLQELANHGHVPHVSVEMRSVPITPMQKLYVLNGKEVLFGFYNVRTNAVTLGDGTMDIYDVLGLYAPLFHYSDAHGPQSADFVKQSLAWFDSYWSTLAHPLTLLE